MAHTPSDVWDGPLDFVKTQATMFVNAAVLCITGAAVFALVSGSNPLSTALVGRALLLALGLSALAQVTFFVVSAYRPHWLDMAAVASPDVDTGGED